MLIGGSPVRTPERAAGPKKDPDASATVVTDYIAPATERHVPQMLLATTVVAVLPLVVSLALRASGMVSGWVSVGLAVVMSLASSTAGSAYWRKRGGNGEVLFGELLLWGWIRSRRQERELANATRLLDLVNTGVAAHDQHDELRVEQREHLLQQLAGALEGQDVYLNGHSRRVARHATMIARGMGLSSDEVARIRAAAAVHDVGKLRTPKAVLNKPDRLTDEEFAVIKRHPVDGAEMVAALGDPELTRIVRHHHERLDGAGYPDRLQGEEIPLGARIIAVADTFDAITSARPYRGAAPHQKAIDILRTEAGTQLDPEAVRSFLAYYAGSRPTVVWAIITSGLRRVVSWLTGDPAAAATISASKVAAATAATAAIGAAAAAAPVPVVHHVPVRPLVSHAAHSVPAHPHGAAVRPGQHAVSVLVRATSPAKRTKASPAKPRRRNVHTATPSRPHAQPSAARHANSPATQAGTGSQATAGAVTSSHAQTGAATGTTLSTPSSAGTTRQSAGTPSATGTVTTTPQPSASAPATQSQGSSANGNAYGHTKLLGNGHGNGLANGHGNSSSGSSSSGTTSTATPTVPLPAIPTPTPSSGASPGSDGGSSHGNGHGQGHDSNSAVTTAITTPPPIATPTPTPSNAGSNGDQDNGNGNGNDSHGHGHG